MIVNLIPYQHYFAKIELLIDFEFQTANAIELYDRSLNKWSRLNDIAIDRINYSVVLINYRLMLIGGTKSQPKNTEPLNTV